MNRYIMKKFIEWMKIREEDKKLGVKNPDEIKSDMEIKSALVNAATTGQDPKKALQDKANRDAKNPNKSPDEILKTTEIINKIKPKDVGVAMGGTKK